MQSVITRFYFFSTLQSALSVPTWICDVTATLQIDTAFADSLFTAINQCRSIKTTIIQLGSKWFSNARLGANLTYQVVSLRL
jgi:hypothetical protein